MSTVDNPEIPQHIQQKFDERQLDPTCCIFVTGSYKKEDECPICYVEISDNDLLIKESGCQHTFCTQCFLESTTTRKKCPMCRRAIGIMPQQSSLDHIAEQMGFIADYLFHSLRQVNDYWGESGITETTFNTAHEAFDYCLELHVRTSPIFIFGIGLEDIHQSDVTEIEEILDYAMDVMREIIAKLADWGLPRSDRLTAATLMYNRAAMAFEELIDLYPRIEVPLG